MPRRCFPVSASSGWLAAWVSHGDEHVLAGLRPITSDSSRLLEVTFEKASCFIHQIYGYGVGPFASDLLGRRIKGLPIEARRCIDRGRRG